jgi:hypothetical protein
MSRLAVLSGHPKRTLASLAALMVAAALVVGSGAVFSSQTANPSNTFASGVLSQSNSKANSAVLQVSQIVPGSNTSHASSGTVDVKNTGTVGGVFTLGESGVVDQDSADGAAGNGTSRSANKLSDQLKLVVQDCGAFSGNTPPSCPADSDVTTGVKYSGVVSGVGSSQALSTYAVSEQHRYKFLVWLPDNGTTGVSPLSSTSVGGTGDNAYSGAYSAATFQFNSTSS